MLRGRSLQAGQNTRATGTPKHRYAEASLTVLTSLDVHHASIARSRIHILFAYDRNRRADVGLAQSTHTACTKPAATRVAQYCRRLHACPQAQDIEALRAPPSYQQQCDGIERLQCVQLPISAELCTAIPRIPDGAQQCRAADSSIPAARHNTEQRLHVLSYVSL